MSSSSPLVSISCITYNHAPFIRQCLDGFLMQQCDFEYEILIHDDASTDGTSDIIREYQNKYPDIIKPIIQTENQWSKGVRGISPRFNFPRAQGKYIALCEGDDYWTDPLKLQKQVDFLEANPDFGSCFGSFVEYFENTKSFAENSRPNKLVIDERLKGMILGVDSFFQGWYMQMMTMLARRNIIQSIDSSPYTFFQDIHLNYELLKVSKAICFPDVFGVYRKHDGGVYSGLKENQMHYRHYVVYEDLYLNSFPKDFRILNKAQKSFKMIKNTKDIDFINFYKKIKIKNSRKKLFSSRSFRNQLYVFTQIPLKFKTEILMPFFVSNFARILRRILKKNKTKI